MNLALQRPSVRLLVWGVLLGVGMSAKVAAAPRLESDRPHVRFRLAGPMRLAGTPPLGLEALPTGHYRLEFIGPGLPRSVGRLTMNGSDQLAVSPMTGPLALALPPGFLHLEQSEVGRGTTMIAVATIAGTGAVLNEISRGQALDDQAQAEYDYATAVSPEEFLEARLDFNEATAEVEDAQEVRNIWAALLGYTWLGAAAETWLLTPRPRVDDRGAGNYSVSVDEATSSGAFVRSLIVPGGGQRYLGHAARGAIFLGLVGGMASGAVLAHTSYLSAQREEDRIRAELDAETNPQEIPPLQAQLEEASDDTTARDRLRWVFIGATVGSYIWNLLDTPGLTRNHAAPANNLSLNVAPTGDGLLGQLTWRLP